MARKNRNAVRVSKARRDKDEVRPPKIHSIRRVPPEEIVTPDGRCNFRSRAGKSKARFATEEKAQKALEQAQLQRRRNGSGHVEKRYYPCPEGGCGGYHLTSREAYEERGKA